MSQKDINSLLIDAIDELNMLIHYQDLVTLVIEQLDSCDDDKSDRVYMLIDLYRQHSDCSISNIKSSLSQLLKQSID